MGSMMTLLGFFFCVCVSVSKFAISSSLHSFSAPGWGRGFTAQMDAYLTWPLNVIYIHRSYSEPDSLPSQCWPNTTKYGLFVLNVTHFYSLYSTGAPCSYTHIDDHPLNNMHTHPHYRATAIPLWMMRLSWDGDKWAFITTMIAPSSTRDRVERKRRSPPSILPSIIYHVQVFL